jgi:hypothetical protein
MRRALGVMSKIRSITTTRTGSALAGLALTLILFFHAPVTSAQNRCWTAVGSTGTVDEAHLGIVALSSNSAAVTGAVTNATVDIRYNVVAVDGVFGGDQRTKTLMVRFADNGPAAQVIVRLRRLNISNGVSATLVELNSDDYASSNVAQTQSKSFNCQGPEFNFEDNIYYFEVQLIKTGVGGNPLIRSIQICGNGIC